MEFLCAAKIVTHERITKKLQVTETTEDHFALRDNDKYHYCLPNPTTYR